MGWEKGGTFTAAEVAAKLLEHHPEYGGGLVGKAARQSISSLPKARTVERWFPKAPWNVERLDARLSLYRLALLDGELHRLPLDNLAAVEAKLGGTEVEIAQQQADMIAEIKGSEEIVIHCLSPSCLFHIQVY